MEKENRRYYWLRLKDDFFASKEMKLLRKLPGGAELTIIYQKMMLASLKYEGKIYFDGVGDDLAEEIAVLIDEDIEAVRLTLHFLVNKRLLTTCDSIEYQLEQVPELIGSETASTRRSRKHRELQKALQCNTLATECNGEKERDKERDKEIDKDISSRCIDNKYDLQTLFSDFESSFGRLLSPFEIEGIQVAVEKEGYREDLIREALKEAVFRGKPVWNYIKAILRNWKNENIHTVEQVAARNQELENPKEVTASAEFFEAMDLWKEEK
ncbi:TPA: phage replisome organizer N-terminal domain-containing protein [Streptococcus suis]|nr:phage replisome organizer N-terminal domain-containing protein [Streptococcus suis]